MNPNAKILDSWWLAPEGQAFSAVHSVITKIREAQAWRQEAHEYHAALYFGGSMAAGLKTGDRVGYEYTPSALPFNVIRRTAGAMTARIARTRPQPIVQSTAGSWRDMKRALKATQLIEGEFYRQRFWPRIWPLWIRDAEIFGSGFVAVYAHKRAVITDRVLPTEIYVDEWDARYGEPRNLHLVRDMDRGVVKALFGFDDKGKQNLDAMKLIDEAGRLSDLVDWEDTSQSTVDRITLITSWHLCDDISAHNPTTPKADREKHKCTGKISHTLTNCDLEVGEWKRGYFPLCKVDYEAPCVGYIGQGIAEQLEGTQYEINMIEERQQEAFKLIPGLWIFNPGGAVLDSHFTNGLGTVIATTPGQMPQVITPQVVHEQLFQRQQMLVQSAADDTGQTQQGMQGAKQPGVNAAVAMRELEEQESARHVVFARAAEEACLEYSRQILDCVKEIADEYGDHSVVVPMNDGLLPLKWSECDTEQYTLRVFSSSVLPQSRPARVQTLNEWFEMGIIDRETYLRQLEASDLQAETDLVTAGRVLVDEVLETMLFCDNPDDPDSYLPPSQFVDPKYAIARTQQKILWAQLRKAPEENLALLQRHIVDYEEIVKKTAAGIGQPQTLPAGAPPGSAPPPGAGAPPVAPGPIPGAMPGGPGADLAAGPAMGPPNMAPM